MKVFHKTLLHVLEGEIEFPPKKAVNFSYIAKILNGLVCFFLSIPLPFVKQEFEPLPNLCSSS